MTGNKSFGDQKDKEAFSDVDVSSLLRDREVGPDELLRSLPT